MSEAIDETIKEIAVRHGVVLSKDDPILILQTMNERLLEETRKAQQEMLAQFKEEMENISSQWKDDAKDKAEKVLSAALASSKAAMSKLLQESTSESVRTMKKMISDSLTEACDLTQQARRFSRFPLLSSIAILIGFVLTCVVHFLR
ncbi:TPA: conjugal transfer protein TraM [Legionella pneumophila]|uniref:TraM protein n=1 Tax=Legionella pneumophila subsp. pneumophila TaxID=91891 RepID=A0AAV2V0D9_LEGPN|nr:conjugal transfer protein TraM [Legionella pneumophila]AMQ28668.1 conjugal transfer protein TraM [Legionella pneumophila subsp. pneumophila]ANN93367.1 conjugal transfer protein TraM [Legionella pneumophila]MCH9063165.1 conjugal transfer protein TraM [Legionella pneumophila serogroup 1]MCH9091267.1 conjugal transfer protein TraM [Legionella pneumophila serogroup 1]MCH9132813.1 conjugal transfer protein TraM [Legionella pneumophila serogroup 1]